MKWIFLVLIFHSFLFSFVSGQVESRLVSSVEEFYEHMRIHRERVKILGVELFRSHPELFEGLRLEQVMGILEAHDMAKMTSGSLAPDGRPFYRVLYTEGYGRKLDQTIMDALNLKDKEIMMEALKKYGLDVNPDLLAKMARIESIADKVDRSMSLVSAEEFGRPMLRASNSTYLTSDEDKKLALELEEKYQKVVGHLEYKKLSPLQRKSLSHQLAVSEISEIKNMVKDRNFQTQCIRTFLLCFQSSFSVLDMNECRLIR